MLTFAYYILKVIVCSGILYGYYLLALKDKIFHSWNRFYLLTAVTLSLAAPLITINIWQKPQQPATQVIHLIQQVNANDEVVFEFTKHQQSFHIDASNVSLFIYTIISTLLLFFLIKTLLKINYLKRSNGRTVIEGINFFNTNAKGTPFSFFNNIFWNCKIDLNTSSGKQIFKHEVAHVREKHSYDKIFMNIVLILFWCNPIFWLMKKELTIIHEFIADKKAIEDNDTAAFAAMVLQATYPQHQFSITNNFFYSPLKRRLAMLTKNNNPKINYLSRLLVLPLAAFVFFAFTLKMKTNNYYTGKKINVVIDAGHGGSDPGVSENNTHEKDIALLLAKQIKALNTNDNINIILTRNADSSFGVKDRVSFAKSVNADLFISIHLDGEYGKNRNTHSGMSFFIPGNDNSYLNQSRLLGSDMVESFKNSYPLPVPQECKQRNRGIYVLNASQCPSVLIEVGFLTTQKDFDYLIKQESQEIIARNILNGIEKYALNNYLSAQKNIALDTIPETKNVPRNNAEDEITTSKKKAATYSETKKDVTLSNITFTPTKPGYIEMKADTFIIEDKEQKPPFMNNTLFIMNGRIINRESVLNKLVTAKVVRVYPANNEEAIKLYGEAAKNGVTVFTDATITEKKENLDTDTIPKKFEKVFTQTETPPQFPGGDEAWKRYITKVISNNINELADENKPGTCRVRFIVNEDGSVSDVTALTMKGTKLGEISINAIRRGPKWVPAMQNGHIVEAYKEQPITFTIELSTNDKTVEVGDYILVHLTHANSNVKIKCPITNVGRIYLKGEYVMVKGLKFEDAKTLLKNRFQKIEPNGTEIEISLNKKS